MKATYKKYILTFKRPSGTSRGVMTEKQTWFLLLEENGKTGIGECGILRTLSFDDRPDYEEKLQWVCQNIHLGKDKLWDELVAFPSIQFGVEMAFLSLASKTPFDLFPSEFTKGKKNMLINGLVWMGEESFMKTQIEEKLAQGFSCIKLKIGAIDFEKELGLLRFIRQNFDAKTIEIRVDANGAFGLNEALNKLNQLSEFELHSIEQPIPNNDPTAFSSDYVIKFDEILSAIDFWAANPKIRQMEFVWKLTPFVFNQLRAAFPNLDDSRVRYE